MKGSKQHIISLILDEDIILDDAEIYTCGKRLSKVLAFILILADDDFMRHEDKMLDFLHRVTLRVNHIEELIIKTRYCPVSLFMSYLSRDNIQDERHVNLLAFFFKNVEVKRHYIKPFLKQSRETVNAVIATGALNKESAFRAIALLYSVIRNSSEIFHDREFNENFEKLLSVALDYFLSMYTKLAKFLRD